MLDKVRNRNAIQADIESQRRVMRNIEDKETNPNEREVLEFREKHRQKEILEELKQWKKLERDTNNKGMFLTKDYYFNSPSIRVPNQFANPKATVLHSPNTLSCPNLMHTTPKIYGQRVQNVQKIQIGKKIYGGKRAKPRS